MPTEIRAIRDDDFGAVAEILQAAYGPGPGRADRVRRYRALGPETWLLALADGEPAGMAGALDYGAFAYVGLVGVLPSMQRRGIALALMERLLAMLEARGCPTVLLDASEAGAPLYRKLGFVDDDVVRLFVGEPRDPETPAAARAMTRQDLAAVAALDRRIAGADRSGLLAGYFEEEPERAFVAEAGGRVSGFAFAQRYTIGPWVADEDGAAASALDAALACSFAETTTVAVPAANAASAALLEARGFSRTRSLAHMRLGPPVARCRDRIYGQASLAAG